LPADRVEKLRQELEKRDVDAVFISQPQNRFYLSGFTGSAGYLLITQQKAFIATDFRYFEQVEKQSPDFTLFKITGKIAEWFPKLLEMVEMQKMGFETTDVTFAFYEELSKIRDKERPGLQLVPLENLVETLRAVKDPSELKLIQRAAEISDHVFVDITERLKPGVTEKEVAWMLEKAMREAGSGPVPFEVIVAAGPNGAMAHHSPSDRPIEAGESVVIDMGASFEGYASDLTRTICLGEPDATFENIYGIVQKAQKAAIDGITEGMTGAQADSLARNIIETAGYGQMFGHSLGHGVGLSVHDPMPHLSKLSEAPLRNGMVFSIEPGIYTPEWGGVRIEDLAVMENGRVRLLSHAKKYQL